MPATSKLSLRRLAALLATVMLAACASPGDATRHTTHHPGQSDASPAQPSSGTSSRAQSADGPMGGQSAVEMCAMHRHMQNMPAEQRQAMMDQHMKAMSPEMRQRHMEMMRQHCK